MTSFQNDPSQARTPPTSDQFAFQPEPTPPVWPKVIGITSIVLGSLGVVCGLCTAISTIGAEHMMSFAAQMQAQGGPQAAGPAVIPTSPMPAALKPGILSILSIVIWPIAAIVMLVAGVLLLQRKPSGRAAHLAYVGLSLLGTALGLVGAFMSQAAMQEFFRTNPDNEWTRLMQAQGASQAGMQTAQAIGISILSLIYPIFIAIWFVAVKKDPAEISRGALTDVI